MISKQQINEAVKKSTKHICPCCEQEISKSHIRKHIIACMCAEEFCDFRENLDKIAGEGIELTKRDIGQIHVLIHQMSDNLHAIQYNMNSKDTVFLR